MRSHLALSASLLLAPVAMAQGTPMAQLKVTEVSAFKDGHAFVLRSGEAPVGADGRVVLEDLPSPVLGTFWPAVQGDKVALRSVTASRRLVTKERTALDLRQLVLANVGADVVVRETGDVRYQARILGVPTRPPEEVRDGAAGAEPPVSERSDFVLLRTETVRKDVSVERVADQGTRLVRLDRIVDLTFLRDPKGSFTDEELRNQLLLDVDLKGNKPATVPVALSWLEKGFRWIPGYRVVIDGKGMATLRLQATLVNDLVDLDQSTVHLVVGVPSFVAKGLVDPIALQATAAAVAARLGPSQTQDLFSNAIMTQGVGQNFAPYAPPAAGEGPELAGSRKEEDLFVFTLKGVTLKRRERMVVTVAELTAPYRDVWKLDVTVTPPPEIWEQLRNHQGELARLLTAPKVEHRIRIENRGKAPFTTAPALVLLGERVLAQGMMTYTAAGQTCDVTLTTAVDLLVRKSDKETGRTPNAVRWNDNTYTRIDLEGTLSIRNRRGEAVEVEVQRWFLGKLTSATAGGTIEQINQHEDSSYLPEGATDRAFGSYRWPHWWHDLNGVGCARWTVRIEPGKDAEVGYAWHYHWR